MPLFLKIVVRIILASILFEMWGHSLLTKIYFRGYNRLVLIESSIQRLWMEEES